MSKIPDWVAPEGDTLKHLTLGTRVLVSGKVRKWGDEHWNGWQHVELDEAEFVEGIIVSVRYPYSGRIRTATYYGVNYREHTVTHHVYHVAHNIRKAHIMCLAQDMTVLDQARLCPICHGKGGAKWGGACYECEGYGVVAR